MARHIPRVTVVCDHCKRCEDIEMAAPDVPSVWQGQAVWFDLGALPEGWEQTVEGEDVCDVCIERMKHEAFEQMRRWG